MVDSGPVLGAFADLILRLSGAGSVTLALSGPAHEHPSTMVTTGDLAPVDELRDEAAVRRLHDRYAARGAKSGGRAPAQGVVPVVTTSDECALFRLPARWGGDSPYFESGGERNRRADRSSDAEPAVWLGLRFVGKTSSLLRRKAPIEIPFEASEGEGEGWWHRLFTLAGALTSHAHFIDLAFNDPVTRLPTRSGFKTEFTLALEQAQATGHALALLLVNPDDYAGINERYGRAVGDAVLAEIARDLRGKVRVTDRVSRYGGATFSVVLADVDQESAEVLTEKIRCALEQRAYTHGGIRLTFSIGMTCVTGEATTSPNALSEAVRRADHALFRAKREGGSRLFHWSGDPPEGEFESVDRLRGMFTCDPSIDYRNMALLWEVVQSIARAGDPAELCEQVAERLQSWLRAQAVAIVELAADGRQRVVARRRLDGEGAKDDSELDAAAIELCARALDAGQEVFETGPDPDASAVPLLVGERRVGALYLQRPEIDGRDAPEADFLAALSTQLAIALDRAQLQARQRARDSERREILESEVDELRRVLQSTRLSYASKSMRAVLETARRVAETDVTVLITGDSGTGKELLARTIHQLGDRRDRPLIVVDCGAISETLIDNELFGHEKGAFTGAVGRKQGRLAQADGATVFLDEIGELPVDVQSKLLRFVQEKQLIPVGGTDTVKVDARIIAATNVDLAGRVRAGRFREDLFHRLNVVHLHLPVLRERREDISHLAGLFAQQYASLYRKTGLRLSAEAERLLREHDWPGNVRELQNRLMRAVLFCDGEELRAEDFEDLTAGAAPATEPPRHAAAVASRAADARAETGEPASAAAALLARLSEQVDRALTESKQGLPIGKWLQADLVLAADRATGGNGRRAGALLGLPDSTFRRRLLRARRELQAGLDHRGAAWNALRDELDRFIRETERDGDLAQRLERITLEAIANRCDGDTVTAARLLGVTEATYLKRASAHGVLMVTA